MVKKYKNNLESFVITYSTFITKYMMLSIVVQKHTNIHTLITLVLCIQFCCHQGRFRLRKKPKQDDSTDQKKIAGDQSNKSETVKQNQEEELPDLKDPEVQKATSLIQVVQG